MNADELLADWFALSRQRPFSESTIQIYTRIWAMWCEWLENESKSRAGGALCFLTATSEDVSKFLQSPYPSSWVRHQQPSSDRPKIRYLQLLGRIYDHALGCGIMDRNPTRELDSSLSGDSGPIPQTLTPDEWAAIYSGMPMGCKRSAFRDRAVMLLLMDAGLSIGEMAALERSDVERDILTRSQLQVVIRGSRDAQRRTLKLNLRTSLTLEMWLQVRESISPSPTVKGDPVFLTDTRSRFSRRVLYYLANRMIGDGIGAVGRRRLANCGVTIVRNTRILMWAQSGMSQKQVMQMAGFINAWSFRGLWPGSPGFPGTPPEIDRLAFRTGTDRSRDDDQISR